MASGCTAIFSGSRAEGHVLSYLIYIHKFKSKTNLMSTRFSMVFPRFSYRGSKQRYEEIQINLIEVGPDDSSITISS